MPDVHEPASVELYWLPLGAGGRFVRWNGRVFEAVAAHLQHRGPAGLYHSALQVHLGGDRYVIEQAPVWNTEEPDRGVVCEGAVGSAWLGRSRLFRYEVRRWRDGVIPDVSEAVDSPRRLSTDEAQARLVLDLVPSCPAVTWGRDELRAGEMWNSNSVISWLLARSGHDAGAITPPRSGRAPGWSAGLVVARRDGNARAGRTDVQRAGQPIQPPAEREGKQPARCCHRREAPVSERGGPAARPAARSSPR